MSIQETIAPLGHTIIALLSPPNGESGAEDSITAWIDHLNSVSDAINQKPAILVIPFADVDDPALPFIGGFFIGTTFKPSFSNHSK